MSDLQDYFFPIQPGFLNRNWSHGFDIYYKTEVESEAKFLQYAVYSPETHDQIYGRMSDPEADQQEFYIHETDLVHYYRDFLIKNLKEKIAAAEKPDAVILKEIYDLICRVLAEYFDDMASTRIFRALDDLAKVLAECMAKMDVTIPLVFGVANKENHTYSHCANVALYCTALGCMFKLKVEELQDLAMGGIYFDIGKKDVDYELLTKAGVLTQEEFKYIRKHPMAGKQVVAALKRYKPGTLSMVSDHHEKWNGEGYPAGLVGEKISIQARICGIMDVFSALTSDRSYRKRLPPAKAFSVMKNEMPGSFDNRILAFLLKSLTPQSQTAVAS